MIMVSVGFRKVFLFLVGIVIPVVLGQVAIAGPMEPIALGVPNMLAIDPPKYPMAGIPPAIPQGVLIHPAVLPPGVIGFQQLQNVPPPMVSLGMLCLDNFTCAALPNSHCMNNSCQCLPSFMEDPMFPGTCRLAPGYNELCASGEIQCRDPFVCNGSAMCDCPNGYIQEYFQCVRDCPSGQIPVGEDCYQGKQLGEQCKVKEQCMQSHAQCLHGQCQCIPGTNQVNGKCYPVNQCPLGEPAKDTRGKLMDCKADTKDTCPKDYYCLYAEYTDSRGFCCPKIKMNCPIGKPLEGKNCSNCPWESHHCFSYVIGSYTETMCCPNACPSGQPIQKDGQCYSRAAFGGHCMVSDQCYNVVGAVCRKDTDSKNRCLCPEGNFKNYFGKCLRESKLGEKCEKNEECRAGTNTVCSNGMCSCYQGYMPEPLQSASRSPEKCIAEPSCPTAAGVSTVEGAYEDCSNDPELCSQNQFCRKWWFDGNKTYSLCCPKPRMNDYEAICSPFRMRLLLAESQSDEASEYYSDSSDGHGPRKCDIAPFPHQLFLNDQAGSVNDTTPQFCPQGSSCLFDPYSLNKGVCCQAVDEPLSAAAAIAAIAANAPTILPPPAPPAPVAAPPTPPARPVKRPESRTSPRVLNAESAVSSSKPVQDQTESPIIAGSAGNAGNAASPGKAVVTRVVAGARPNIPVIRVRPNLGQKTDLDIDN